MSWSGRGREKGTLLNSAPLTSKPVESSIYMHDPRLLPLSNGRYQSRPVFPPSSRFPSLLADARTLEDRFQPMATAMRVIDILPHRGRGAGIAHSGSLWSSSGSS